MKFHYAYQTRENKRVDGVIGAPSRGAVYAVLRQQGIRPFVVEECPGFFNKLFGKGKRWLAIGILFLIAVGLAVRLTALRQPTEEDRSQVYGDPSILLGCESSGWRNVFSDPGDAYLARHAQPGRDCGCPCGAAEMSRIVASLRNGGLVEILDSDAEEAAKMKRMVNGMKSELRAYMKAGGSVESYLERVEERQRTEATIYSNNKTELDQLLKILNDCNRAETILKWEAHNRILREMGLRTVAMPIDVLGGGENRIEKKLKKK